MTTTETIIYPKEGWITSIFSIARYYGDMLIPEGEPADLILKEWQPIYKALGRDGFFEYLKTQSFDLKEARKYVKQ